MKDERNGRGVVKFIWRQGMGDKSFSTLPTISAGSLSGYPIVVPEGIRSEEERAAERPPRTKSVRLVGNLDDLILPKKKWWQGGYKIAIQCSREGCHGLTPVLTVRSDEQAFKQVVKAKCGCCGLGLIVWISTPRIMSTHPMRLDYGPKEEGSLAEDWRQLP